MLAPDLLRRPLLPRPHLLVGGIARHGIYYSKPLRVRDGYYHRADSRISIYGDGNPVTDSPVPTLTPTLTLTLTLTLTSHLSP